MKDNLSKRILETELRLLEPICEVVECIDHTIYRSELFPSFYYGNIFSIKDNFGKSITEWETQFHSEFPRPRYLHETFLTRYTKEVDPLIQDAKLAGYNVDFEQYMAITKKNYKPNHHLEGLLNNKLSILKVEDDSHWEMFTRFHHATASEEDWYDNNDKKENNHLIDKTRFVADAIGVEWYLIVESGNEMPIARAGVFYHNNLARLQDIETLGSHRRKGYASSLIQFILRNSFERANVDAVCLCADESPPALELYKHLGFEAHTRNVCLMRYPKTQ